MMQKLDKMIKGRAKTLIARYGKEAVKYAQDQAEKAPMGAFPSEKDIALRVLTKVEELV
ncbi:MAG: hypothetical protein ACTSXQ_06180 [Alphaproteobacteria bacterium]